MFITILLLQNISVEDCSNAFLELIQSCDNGAAIAVYKGAPPIVIPEFSYPLMISMAGAAIMMSKVRHILKRINIILEQFR